MDNELFIENIYELGLQKVKENKLIEALDIFNKINTVNNQNSSLLYNIGCIYTMMGDYINALKFFNSALQLNPYDADTLINKATTLHQLNNFNEALVVFDEAISLGKNNAMAWNNKANTLNILGKYNEALTHYQVAIEKNPDIQYAYGNLINLKMKMCIWKDIKTEIEDCVNGVLNKKNKALPFMLLPMIDDPYVQKLCSSMFVELAYPQNDHLGEITKRSKSKKIRIGYYSSDFREHPVSRLTAELYEKHDRKNFEIYAFSFNKSDGSNIYARLYQAFDKFTDVSSMSDYEVATLSRSEGIDIAVDLGGHTTGSRFGVFACRAAPIQVSYLGYLGTTGASYIDYLISDKTVIPEKYQSFYTEKIAYLPTFQANDTKREILKEYPSRADLGLPADSFIFCSFNNTYKILPEIYALWMQILKCVDGSVIYLYAENQWAADNLQKEAVERGIDSKRIIFGKRVSYQNHLARLKLCDLFLDTAPYNAGATASDALWTGLPVLTILGESFSSRMGASILNAAGLQELIATSPEQYVKMAIKIAKNQRLLNDIKKKMDENRTINRLFDTTQFVKKIEEAYLKMYERYQLDLGSDHIYL